MHPWYFDPPIYGLLNPLPMVFWPPYPLYFDLPTHGISNPLPMVFWPSYPWYIDPPTHGILTSLPMVYRTPYPWYFDPYPWYFDCTWTSKDFFVKCLKYLLGYNMYNKMTHLKGRIPGVNHWLRSFWGR